MCTLYSKCHGNGAMNPSQCTIMPRPGGRLVCLMCACHRPMCAHATAVCAMCAACSAVVTPPSTCPYTIVAAEASYTQ